MSASSVAAQPGSKMRSGVRGRDVTTFAIGGELRQFVEPDSIDQVRSLQAHAGSAVKVLGAGSNLLIPEHGIETLTIRLGRGFRYSNVVDQDAQSVRIEVGGSMPLMSLSRSMSEQGFSGLEFAGGIPASFGGAVWMNAGAHGSEISRVIQNVSVVLPEGNVQKLSRDQIPFAYRHSGLPQGAVVVSAEIVLKKADPAAVQAHRAECLAERKRRQPLTVPSAGSIFRNPRPDLTAGMVLERAGCKGLKVGGAEVSGMHANWIVNPERKAKAEDVSQLMELCVDRAREAGGVELVSELVRW